MSEKRISNSALALSFLTLIFHTHFMNKFRPDLNPLAPQIMALAEEAGQIICHIYKEEIDVFKKKDGSPVTRADYQSHDFLKRGLNHITPDIPVISEEDESSWILKSPLYWLIDPLDGTKGFIHKTGEFCINIALMQNDAPIFGLIHIPLTQEIFYGYEKKAYHFFKRKMTFIQTRFPPPQGMTLLLGGNEKKYSPQEDFFLKVYSINKIERILSAIKFAYIAAGQADLYLRFEACGEWDTAAGQALVEAAGGIVTQLNGNSFLYGKPGLINEGFVVFGRKP